MRKSVVLFVLAVIVVLTFILLPRIITVQRRKTTEANPLPKQASKLRPRLKPHGGGDLVLHYSDAMYVLHSKAPALCGPVHC